MSPKKIALLAAGILATLLIVWFVLVPTVRHFLPKGEDDSVDQTADSGKTEDGVKPAETTTTPTAMTEAEVATAVKKALESKDIKDIITKAASDAAKGEKIDDTIVASKVTEIINTTEVKNLIAEEAKKAVGDVKVTDEQIQKAVTASMESESVKSIIDTAAMNAANAAIANAIETTPVTDWTASAENRRELKKVQRKLGMR